MNEVRDRVEELRTWLEAPGDPGPTVVETSGSSGAPKRVELSRAAVRASIDATADRLGATGRWLLMLPPQYVAGTQVIARSLAAGHDPVVLADEHSFRSATIRLGRVDRFCSLVPAQLFPLLGDPETLACLRTFHTVLLGGGPMDAALRTRAEAEGVHVVSTYGAAETAGGCVYDGVPLDGVSVDLEDDGRIRIGGPTLFSGYADDPELTAEALTDGWFRTADTGQLDDSGRLRVLGRVDDMVISGGLKVPAQVIAGRLREHPQIADAEALGIDHAQWGQELVAFVEPAGDRAPRLPAVRDWVGEAFPRSWAPKRVVVVDEIPMLDSGKPDRVALRGLA